MATNLRTASRNTQWESFHDSLSLEQINCGSMLRIADAMETVAKDREQLVRIAESRKSNLEWERKRNKRLLSSNAGLRGRIKVLLRKIEEMKGAPQP